MAEAVGEPADRLRQPASSADPVDQLRKIARELREATARVTRSGGSAPAEEEADEAAEIRYQEGRLIGFAEALVSTRPDRAIEARAIVDTALADL